MSNEINTQILERISDEVNDMPIQHVKWELGDKADPFTKVDTLRDMLVNQRFEEWPEGPQ
jgi:hypothetical protein